jgi:hypothetical protein
MILMWVQNSIKDYPIPMTNFSTCWNDGLAFCALIHVFYPDNFDWYSLDTKNRKHNFTLAFDKAEQLADICPLLEVEDMVKFQKPDWKCVFTYVQSFYRRFRDGRNPANKFSSSTCATGKGLRNGQSQMEDEVKKKKSDQTQMEDKGKMEMNGQTQMEDEVKMDKNGQTQMEDEEKKENSGQIQMENEERRVLSTK